MNPRPSLALLLTALLAVTACGDPVSGAARRASTTTTGGTPGGVTTSPSGGVSPSPSGGPTGSLDTTDPCALITRAEAEQALGPLRKEPKAGELGGARTCSFAPRTATFLIGIRTTVGLAGVQPDGGVLSDVTIGDRPAKELLGVTRSCGVYLGVSDSSRVDVVLNATSSGEEPCPLARRIAELVEPRLP
ncbi:DUF3558 domain-containing protein [Saccharothrix australiensis]|uniref:Uncharacterized protein DUF3558 n=1 Tax=Saccharothrix australiensis TaxID=2072 RepID=A0A495W883_9PSEU|nr:DUF3558 domain-containing protein [Saccharothrix australiensis]RKT57337.1 uncharacterized protein DUF3558 [Saccharothrix australiensis]